jgi:hypothetical protein
MSISTYRQRLKNKVRRVMMRPPLSIVGDLFLDLAIFRKIWRETQKIASENYSRDSTNPQQRIVKQ